MNAPVVITHADPRAPGPMALLTASHALMRELFTPEQNYFLSVDELCTPDIRFFAATVDGKLLGVAALSLKPDYGEIKSMFVGRDARGLGIATALIRHVENQAAQAGKPTLRLETGDALAAACRLYEHLGFKRCGAFGDYVENNSSVFMEKHL